MAIEKDGDPERLDRGMASRQGTETEPSDEHGCDADGDPVKARLDNRLAVERDRGQPDQGNGENASDKSGKRGILRASAQLHQTFSTSGRPSSPEGRKTSTRIRIPKT